MNDDTKIQKPKRKYLREEFSNICDIAVDGVENLKNTVNAIESGKISESARILHDTETRGDIVRNRIKRSFSLDKHPPSIQLDRMKLLNKIETIINKCEHAGYKIETGGKYYPRKFMGELKIIMDEVRLTVVSVSKGVKILFDSFEGAVDEVKEVEDTRDKIRELVFKLQQKALDDPEINHKNLFALDIITTQISSVAEKSKDVTDLIGMMRLKYL